MVMFSPAETQTVVPSGRSRHVPGRPALALPLLMLVAILTGCGGSHRGMVVSSSFHSFSPEEKIMRQSASLNRYRLHAGDVIEVDFKYEDKLDRKDILILPDGRFTIPGIDQVRAVGRTIGELDSLLTARFGLDYRNPELSISVSELGRREVYVFGEVNKPGGHPLNGTSTGVLQTIALAGGFTQDASRGEVLVIRADAEGYFYRVLDLSHLEKRGPEGLFETGVRGNDIVYVPRGALGDLRVFGDSFLKSAFMLSDIFWDVYAISNLDKVDRLVR